MVKLETEIAFWLDAEGIKVFLGEDDSPAVTQDLMELVRNEVMVYAVPATAQGIDDIKELHDDDDGIQKLRNRLQDAIYYLDLALSKKVE
jgi:hypothetical protein